MGILRFWRWYVANDSDGGPPPTLLDQSRLREHIDVRIAGNDLEMACMVQSTPQIFNESHVMRRNE